MQQVILAGGCFWGLEDLFRARPGVVDTQVGYCGGQNQNPNYDFHPGHAEALQISFDESATSLANIYDYFFRIHDPTTLNRQGNDQGTSYRSAIFYQSPDQKQAAKTAIERNQKHWNNQIVTSLEPLEIFWPAEDFHQGYLVKNPAGYTCHWERSR